MSMLTKMTTEFPGKKKKILFKCHQALDECLCLLLPVTPDLVSKRQAGADVLRKDYFTDLRRSIQQLAGNGEAVIAEETAKRVKFMPGLCVCVSMCSLYLVIQVGCSW